MVTRSAFPVSVRGKFPQFGRIFEQEPAQDRTGSIVQAELQALKLFFVLNCFMLDEDRLAIAISTQKKSYSFLQWVSDAMDSGKILATNAAQHSDDPSAVLEWISNYEGAIPAELRPDALHRSEFANFFWTYVVTSFEVVIDPGKRGYMATGCTCDLCVHLVNASHLRPKKLRTRDKKRALDLIGMRVQNLANEHAIEVDAETARRIVEDPRHRRDAAFSSYGEWLINRLDGETDGPSVLALWREIAWNRSGSPIQGFSLKLNQFIEAEQSLLGAMSLAAARPNSEEGSIRFLARVDEGKP